MTLLHAINIFFAVITVGSNTVYWLLYVLKWRSAGNFSLVSYDLLRYLDYAYLLGIGGTIGLCIVTNLAINIAETFYIYKIRSSYLNMQPQTNECEHGKVAQKMNEQCQSILILEVSGALFNTFSLAIYGLIYMGLVGRIFNLAWIFGSLGYQGLEVLFQLKISNFFNCYRNASLRT